LAEFAGYESRFVLIEPCFQTMAISKHLNDIRLSASRHTTPVEALNHFSGILQLNLNFREPGGYYGEEFNGAIFRAG